MNENKTYAVNFTEPGTDELGTPQGADLIRTILGQPLNDDGYLYAAFGLQTRNHLRSILGVLEIFESAVTREDIANAHLIAAEPDLLEACEKAASIFEYYAQLHRAKGTPEGSLKAAENMKYARDMRAAIAKAKGAT